MALQLVGCWHKNSFIGVFGVRKMGNEDRNIIENKIRMTLMDAVSSDYVRYILEDRERDEELNYIGNTFLEDVIDDVLCSSAWDDEGYYNDDDIRLAIGRVLIERLGIDY